MIYWKCNYVCMTDITNVAHKIYHQTCTTVQNIWQVFNTAVLAVTKYIYPRNGLHKRFKCLWTMKVEPTVLYSIFEVVYSLSKTTGSGCLTQLAELWSCQWMFCVIHQDVPLSKTGETILLQVQWTTTTHCRKLK